MKKIGATLLVFTFMASVVAQEVAEDSIPVRTLDEVIVRAYEQNRQLREVAAPVSIVNQQQLQRFGSIFILPAVNAVSGVRMEERSPGSYRLNIRGSSLRSPFGVRNVKVYWNDIPFTDPGGNTYLNQFFFYNFSSLEILKGPGSSLYGAGTGGVMLINSFPAGLHEGAMLNYSIGSYNSSNLNLSAIVGTESFRNIIGYTRQKSDGYRDQSQMRRDIVTWESRMVSTEKQTLSAHVFYGDLFYETPGALTKAQHEANPKSARPAAPAAGLPGATENKAAIYQKTFMAGIWHQYQFNQNWQNSSSVYGAFSQIRNPAIRNYERRLEPHFGGRTTFSYTTAIKKTILKVVAGAEFQRGNANIKVYKNKLGNTDSLQTDDEVNNFQGGIFAQTEVSFPGGWIATAGMSLNISSVSFNRLSVVPSFDYKNRFNNEVAPRISVLKIINSQLSVYGLLSKGFSPLTTAELLPSTSIINTELQAEQGMNYELGIRGNFLNNRLAVDVNTFDFRLRNAITQRRDASGADFFVNAGNTRQRGLETAFSYLITKNNNMFVRQSVLWLSYTFFHFRYKDFKQVNTDFAGNRIPGIAPHTLAAGIDFSTSLGLYSNINYYYSDRIALNDANAEFASSYNLVGFKAGFKRTLRQQVTLDVFITGDNIFNESYSLGNDINAAGNRFYNAVLTANFLAGVSMKLGL